MPNPNVMLETGYAIALKGWDKVILVANVVFGSPEDLLADLDEPRAADPAGARVLRAARSAARPGARLRARARGVEARDGSAGPRRLHRDRAGWAASVTSATGGAARDGRFLGGEELPLTPGVPLGVALRDSIGNHRRRPRRGPTARASTDRICRRLSRRARASRRRSPSAIRGPRPGRATSTSSERRSTTIPSTPQARASTCPRGRRSRPARSTRSASSSRRPRIQRRPRRAGKWFTRESAGSAGSWRAP